MSHNLSIIVVITIFTACSSGGGGGAGGSGSSGGTGTGSGNNSQISVYKGADLAGNEYTLTITNTAAKAAKKGSSYGMKIKRQNGQEINTEGYVEEIIDDTYTLSSGDTEIDVTIKNGAISSIVGEVTLPDGTVFIVRTFDTVYLRACRFEHDSDAFIGAHNGYGENYNTFSSIKLTDIYSANFDNLLPEFGSTQKVLISGTVDKKIYTPKIDFQHWSSDRKTVTYVGGSPYGTEAIEPGDFSLEITVERGWNLGNNPVPSGGEIEVQLIDALANINLDEPSLTFDSGRKIPEDFPDYGIWATVRNFKIEPVVP